MMGTLHALKSLLVALLITRLNVSAQENDVCTLPDGAFESTCIRLHRCDTFNKIVIKYAGRPPADEVQNIKKHSCGRNQLVCCPDGAKPKVITKAPITATQRPVISTVEPTINKLVIPSPTNLVELKNHPKINLLNQKCGSSTSDRIIFGFKANPGQFPWMALLQYQNLDSLTFNCGGTLISKFYVLSAAHCMLRSLVAVRLGEHDLTTNPDCTTFEEPHEVVCQDPVQDIPVENYFRHPAYSSTLKVNDIALVLLKTAADLTKKNVKTICLPITPENQIDALAEDSRQNMFISGWGKTEHGVPSNVLLQAIVPYVKNSECRKRYATVKLDIPEQAFCAGGLNKTDTCKGDSGGPIQTLGYFNNLPRTFLYGVVSTGVACENPNIIYPGVYTNIAYYLDWILDNMTK